MDNESDPTYVWFALVAYRLDHESICGIKCPPNIMYDIRTKESGSEWNSITPKTLKMALSSMEKDAYIPFRMIEMNGRLLLCTDAETDFPKVSMMNESHIGEFMVRNHNALGLMFLFPEKFNNMEVLQECVTAMTNINYYGYDLKEGYFAKKKVNTLKKIRWLNDENSKLDKMFMKICQESADSLNELKEEFGLDIQI